MSENQSVVDMTRVLAIPGAVPPQMSSQMCYFLLYDKIVASKVDVSKKERE